jgi:hypothetical protein
MRATIVILVSLAAASGCVNGVSEPKPDATQGDEAPPVLSTGSLPITKATDNAALEAAQVVLTEPDEAHEHMFASDVQQSGAKLATPIATKTKLVDMPKCQEL